MSANLGNTALARVKLEEAIENGRAAGLRVIPRILNEVPQDEIQLASTTQLVVKPGQALYQTRLGLSPMTDHAFRQLCERAGGDKFAGLAGQLLEGSKPSPRDARMRQAGELQEEENPNAWKADLLQDAAGRFLEHARGRYLVRRMGGKVHGVLSESFRRLDCRPMLYAFLEAAKKFQAVPAGGEITETRAMVRILVPKVYEIGPGELVVYGIQFGNSDFGAGNYAISDFLLRLLCLNGMTGEKQLKEIHLGKRIGGDLELSNETHRLDSEALCSATVDVVGHLLSDVVLEKNTTEIARLRATELTYEQAAREVGKRLSKAEADKVKDLYEGPDVLNVPQGKDMWRFANAMAFLAKDEKAIPNADRRIELEEMAGALLPSAAPLPKQLPAGSSTPRVHRRKR
jgi:hypothetical protein